MVTQTKNILNIQLKKNTSNPIKSSFISLKDDSSINFKRNLFNKNAHKRNKNKHFTFESNNFNFLKPIKQNLRYLKIQNLKNIKI